MNSVPLDILLYYLCINQVKIVCQVCRTNASIVSQACVACDVICMFQIEFIFPPTSAWIPADDSFQPASENDGAIIESTVWLSLVLCLEKLNPPVENPKSVEDNKKRKAGAPSQSVN